MLHDGSSTGEFVTMHLVAELHSSRAHILRNGRSRSLQWLFPFSANLHKNFTKTTASSLHFHDKCGMIIPSNQYRG